MCHTVQDVAIGLGPYKNGVQNPDMPRISYDYYRPRRFTAMFSRISYVDNAKYGVRTPGLLVLYVTPRLEAPY